jgi:uncharacterized membrane protein
MTKKKLNITANSPITPINKNSFNNEIIVKELMELERFRIESANQKYENDKLYIKANDDANKRMHEYHMQQLKTKESLDKKKHNLAKGIVIVIGSITIILLTILVYYTFMGNELQSALAITTLKYLAVGLGGYGALKSISSSIKKLLEE